MKEFPETEIVSHSKKNNNNSNGGSCEREKGRENSVPGSNLPDIPGRSARIGPYNGLYTTSKVSKAISKFKKKKKRPKIVYETYYPDLEKYEAEQKAKEEDRKMRTLEGYDIDALTGMYKMEYIYINRISWYILLPFIYTDTVLYCQMYI